MVIARTFLLVLTLSHCALISYEITKTILPRVARGRTGRIRRTTRSEAFRHYMIADVLALALCLGIAI
jgi:hypothetical protein